MWLLGWFAPTAGQLLTVTRFDQAWLRFGAIHNCLIPYRGGFFAYMVENLPR